MADVNGIGNIEKQNSNFPEHSNEGQKKECKIFQRKWFVLLSGFFNYFISPGLPMSMSSFYVEFAQEFGQSKAETSLVQSVLIGVLTCGGLISGMLVSRFGTRICGIIGGLISALGFLASSFATSIPFLVVTLGIIVGSGFSVNYVCASTAIGYYFHGQIRYLALAFILVGGGIGSMVFPHLLEFLIEKYGWRGCIMISSGIVFHLCLCNALGKPPPSKMSTSSSNYAENSSAEPTVEKEQGLTTKTKTLSESKYFLAIFNEVKACLGNKQFLIFTFGISIAVGIFFSNLIFMIDFLELRGFGRQTSVWVYFGVNTCNCLFRGAAGLFAQIRQLPNVAFSIIFIAIAACATFVLPSTTTVLGTSVAMCVFGAGMGATQASVSITTLDLIGIENYSTGLGLFLSVNGIFTVAVAPLFGYIRDITDSYDVTFYIGAGSAISVSCALLFFTVLCRDKESKQRYRCCRVLESVRVTQ